MLLAPLCRRALVYASWPGIMVSWALSPLSVPAQNQPAHGFPAPKPLYRDPVFDGAADPVVIWNPHTERWWMFYTNRRANAPGLSGVAWVHGTRIGLAESADGGVTWRHIGTCDIDLPPALAGTEPTHWAPEVITAPDGTHRMWLSVVPGIFENWEHPRTLVHLTSNDLRHWTRAEPLSLSSDRVIDACVIQLEDGTWRLWYNNERDRKSIYFADSPDLRAWTDRGKAIADQEGEGPKVFRWKGAYWMITDVWQGLAVYRSLDAIQWKRQPGPNLLQEPGKGADDGVKGGHPDVVVTGGRAYLFYFTHPGRTPENAKADGTEQRRSSIQVVELKEKDGALSCDRDQPTAIALPNLGNDRDRATLDRMGRRSVSVHDPSTLLRLGDEWWVFATGRGISAWHSKDLDHWQRGRPVFPEIPAWVTEVVPSQTGHFWAPDAIVLDNRVLLYYSVSSFGKNTSAIALATTSNSSLADTASTWKDQGVVVRSSSTDDFNAIDPTVFLDRDGRLWLAFGSFWGGIQLIELNPGTGKRIRADSPQYNLARNREIEAAALHRRGDWYYLFVNWGNCCRGLDSTYEIRVGRSRAITGPYLDKDGVDLVMGGGTIFMAGDGPFIGPGHVGWLNHQNRDWVSVHFYDRTRMGRPTLAVRPVSWTDDAWPTIP